MSACIATPALADNTGKFYGAVDLGSVSFSNATGGPTGTTAFPNPGAFRFAAGYNITPMLAVEAGYAMIGTSQIDSVNFAGIAGVTATETVKSSSVQIAGVANYAINDTFGVFGKLGLANSKVDYAGTTNIGVTASASGSKTALLLGLGAQYNINKQFAIRAQYEDFGKVKVGAGANSDVGIKMVSIGGVYNF